MWYYKQRPLKAADGRDTTFSVDAKGVVYDNIPTGPKGRGSKTMIKVGTIALNGDITVFPKYAKKHGKRLHQLVAENKGCGKGNAQCVHLEVEDEECACALGMPEAEFKTHLSEGVFCPNFGAEQ